MSPHRSPTERSLLDAAASLLERGGPAAVTTRAVLDEAGVTAPTLYHHFGDKDGLLDALLAEGVARYFAHRTVLPETADALADLAASWDLYLDFICEQPQLFSLLMTRAQDDQTLLARATAWCRGRLERLHGEGRLAVEVDFGLQALLVSSNGVAMLRAQGASDGEARDAGRFVFEQTLAGLVRAPGQAGPAAC
ncbi:TetR/AcrR family transcriptional regulator [Phenylobacterium sp.]|mgnify:CR=1 FL=1|uniref:TetR/AcrR family transcriptional regulator n=1 Tax=Phenylobacterium sp. TaxID=1871053 RepID=UPI002604353C|nr:TetR/AcrR family transcriptional regulator [Phenylobacterium sp.]